MATLNVRLDDKLKNEAYAVLEKTQYYPPQKLSGCCFNMWRKTGVCLLKPLRLATAKTYCYRQSGNDWLTHRKESELVWMTYELEFDPRALKRVAKAG